MASKQIALGAILKTDAALASTFVAQTLVSAITYPPRVREEIEGKDLGDTLDVPLLGIEQVSKGSFTQYWHPDDSVHEEMDTEFGANTGFSIQIVTTHSTPVTDEFAVKVTAITPAELTTSGAFMRTVEFVRTGDITRS